MITPASAIVILALASSGGQEARKSYNLLPQVKVGDQFVYDYQSKITVGANESQFNARFAMTVQSLEPKERITFESRQTKGEFVSAGKAQPTPESTTSATFKLNGELLSTTPPSSGAEQARLGRLMMMVVPESPASAGSKWSWESAAEERFGKVGLKGSGECLAIESHRGFLSAKLKLAASESGGAKPAKAAMIVWVAVQDGMPVEVQMNLENAPLFPGTVANLTATNVRVGPKPTGSG